MITKRISLTGQPYNGDNALVINGVGVDIGTRVIKWWEPQGFSQYGEDRAEFKDPKTGKVHIIKGKRYDHREKGIDGVRQVFIHHSGADRATPKIMREVLHNQRGLSVQFAIEDNGVVYQFLDAIEAAQQAGTHNQISIGAECCLFPSVHDDPNYYSDANRAKSGNLPHEIRTETLQGMKMKVFCMPEPQAEAICRWAAGLWFAVCKLGTNRTFAPPRFPRDEHGEIPRKVYDGHLEHVGLIGHLQCTDNKIDPAGFPWESAEVKVAEYFTSFCASCAETDGEG